MDDIYLIEDYKGHRIEVYRDETPSDPQGDMDLLGRIFAVRWDHRYVSVYEELNEHTLEATKEVDGELEDVEVDMEEYLRLNYDAAVVVPVTFFNGYQGGLRIERAMRGAEGALFCTAEEAGRFIAFDGSAEAVERAEGIMLEDVAIRNAYWAGEVFGYQVFRLNEGEKEGDDVDACWGFYGTDFERNGLLEAARNVIDVLVSKEDERQKLIAQGRCPVCKKVPMYPLRHLVTGTRYADYDGSYSDESFRADGEGEYLCPECQTVLARSRADADAFIRRE